MSLKNNRKSVSLNHNELSKRLESIYDTTQAKLTYMKKIMLLPF
ncbi:hypothetical protein WKW43_14230 (plasmid) [Staphylococcus pseudoxylosus]